MNEILVEEENTVYELDPECLRHKEEQRQLEEKRKQEKQENDNYRMQKRLAFLQKNLWKGKIRKYCLFQHLNS